MTIAHTKSVQNKTRGPIRKSAGHQAKPGKVEGNKKGKTTDIRDSKSQKSVPKVGEVVSAKVLVSGPKGVIVLIDGGIHGRIKLSDISTRFISGDDAAQLFPTKTILSDLIVTGVTADGRLELKPASRIGEPEVGSIHKAVVKRVEPYGLIMNFPNSLIRCLCVTEEIDDELTQCKPALARIQPGHKFNVKVIKVDQGKIWVSMKKSIVGEDFASNLPNTMEFQDPTIQSEQTILDADETDNFHDSEQIDDGEMLVSKRVKLIDTSAVAPTVSRQSLSVPDVMDVVEENESGENKKAKKRQRDIAKKQKEQLIREKENEVLSGNWKRDPQTPEEFERLLLVDGKKSAATWIKYMSYWLKMAELGKAREVAERSVKCFASTNDEQEKFNAWIAFLNMEAAFAPPNMVDALFLRAVQYCDPKKVYHAMPQVWLRANNQVEKAQLALEKMTNKFCESRKAWLNLIEFIFNQGRLDEARTLLNKALKSVPKRKHVRVTVKFAQLEYRSGNPERGSTVFEKLISENNSAKTDIWSVYFDEHIKAYGGSDPETVRGLFERAISMRLKAFKTKFFFKRWIDFETKHGNETTIEQVKEKAVAYVESI